MPCTEADKVCLFISIFMYVLCRSVGGLKARSCGRLIHVMKIISSHNGIVTYYNDFVFVHGLLCIVQAVSCTAIAHTQLTQIHCCPHGWQALFIRYRILFWKGQSQFTQQLTVFTRNCWTEFGLLSWWLSFDNAVRLLVHVWYEH